MKEQIVIRTLPDIPATILAKKFLEGYTVVICNPIGDALEYILEKETENSNNGIVGTWIVKVTKDKYHYTCSNCSDKYAVYRKALENSYGEEFKFVKNYCSRCGAKTEHVIHEW